MKKAEKLAVLVEDLNIPTKAKTALAGRGVRTVGDIMRLREIGLRAIPNVADRTIRNIRQELEDMKLYLHL